MAALLNGTDTFDGSTTSEHDVQIVLIDKSFPHGTCIKEIGLFFEFNIHLFAQK